MHQFTDEAFGRSPSRKMYIIFEKTLASENNHVALQSRACKKSFKAGRVRRTLSQSSSSNDEILAG